MFNPSQQEVRQFFCEVWRKRVSKLPMTPLETIAADWVGQHPEYHTLLENPADAIGRVFDGADGAGNPFMHLSMHLSISEQVSIDQPAGIKAAFAALASRFGSAHDAHHVIMECLGQMLWDAQRSNLPPDGAKYVEAVWRQVA